jgi:membrane protein implicated in regulation of membrane protease activity
MNSRQLRLMASLVLPPAAALAGAFVLMQWLHLSLLEFLLLAVTFSVLGDVIGAWHNERAIARGCAALCNDVHGRTGTVLEPFCRRGAHCHGRVRVSGAKWKARSSDADLDRGDRVVVRGREGLVLVVERVA